MDLSMTKQEMEISIEALTITVKKHDRKIRDLENCIEQILNGQQPLI